MVNMILGRSGSDYHTGSMYTGKYSLTQGRKDKYLSHFFKMKLCTGGGVDIDKHFPYKNVYIKLLQLVALYTINIFSF